MTSRNTQGSNIAHDLTPLLVDTDTLVTMPDNPRIGDVEAVARSYQQFGQRKPIVARRHDRVVIAGNHQLAAARQLGWEQIAVVWTDDDDATAKAYALADNRTADLGSYDDDLLAALLADVQATGDDALLAATGYAGDDLEKLLRRVEFMAGQGDPDDFDPEPPAVPVSRPGDVWLLGPHRLVCGDALDPAVIDLALGGQQPGIIYTDPPYGISIVSDAGKVGHHTGMPFGGLKGRGKVVPTTKYRPVAGDENADAAVAAFTYLIATYPAAAQVWWGGNHYSASAGLPDATCWLVWDKDTNGNFADAELAWTNHPGAVRLLRHMWNGMLRATEHGKRVHPTQKPVALAEWAFTIIDPGNERRVVVDVFGGSGSTLIAAHQTQRIAAEVEMEPAYVDVICRRYQQHTGQTPILEATAQPHDFTQDSA
jgi:site-specific DNA-methyltransferase (adenine-specific)